MNHVGKKYNISRYYLLYSSSHARVYPHMHTQADAYNTRLNSGKNDAMSWYKSIVYGKLRNQLRSNSWDYRCEESVVKPFHSLFWWVEFMRSFSIKDRFLRIKIESIESWRSVELVKININFLILTIIVSSDWFLFNRDFFNWKGQWKSDNTSVCVIFDLRKLWIWIEIYSIQFFFEYYYNY